MSDPNPHGVCPARSIFLPEVFEGGEVRYEPHEPDEKEKQWAMMPDRGGGYGKRVEICKHCRGVYVPLAETEDSDG